MHEDGRRRRGAQTRARVARRAAELASVDGLESLSLGQLAADLGLSKSGVAAAFGSKQDLQLATVHAAREIFVEQVVRPALDRPPGVDRLRTLVDAWLGYVEAGVFPGGCFMASVLPEFDDRPGPVRDALRDAHRDWLGLLTTEVAVAQAAGDLPDVPADEIAFEIDALLAAANLSRNLGVTSSLERVRRILDRMLAGRSPSHRP